MTFKGPFQPFKPFYDSMLAAKGWNRTLPFSAEQAGHRQGPREAAWETVALPRHEAAEDTGAGSFLAAYTEQI